MIRVLFVCSGNICRSPMAEAVFQHMVQQAGLQKVIQADSAGTGPWHIGEPPHSGTLSILKRQGIAYRGQARQITHADFNEFDYILGMDNTHLAELRRHSRGKPPELNLFLHYARETGAIDVENVPDPYYNGRFERVYELVEAGCEALINHIRAQHNL